ncbi:MAG TPA: ribonuclease HII [Rhodothermales bacterium]|nr:ribonuclease HII [Rhodothermales bacterium]
MQPSLDLETSLLARGYRHVAGVDEAGRGCLAGPVVAAAVVLPPGCMIEGVDDSKKLSPKAREEVFERIREAAACVGVGLCTPEEIDELNILWAAMEAMRRAVLELHPAPDHLLIDGNTVFPDSPWPFETIVKGDTCCHSIAAASIVAKVTRDRLMRGLHDEHPHYGWQHNVGYPTRDHYDALAHHGPTPHHRRTFRLL